MARIRDRNSPSGWRHKPGTSFGSSSSRGSSGGSGYGGSSSLGSTHASRWEQRQQLEQKAANRGGGSSGGWSAAEMNEGFRPSSSSSSNNTWSSTNRGSSSGTSGIYGSGSSGSSLSRNPVYGSKQELLNTDWKALQNAAEARGDYDAAARYESARNDKIASQEYKGWGGQQQQTHNYSSYTPSYSSGIVHPNRQQDNDKLFDGGTLWHDGRPSVHLDKPWKPGIDYSAEAEKYAAQGDWDAVDDMLMRRSHKRWDTGSLGGGRDEMQVWKDLNDRYGGPSAGHSLNSMYQGANQAYGYGGKFGLDGIGNPDYDRVVGGYSGGGFIKPESKPSYIGGSTGGYGGGTYQPGSSWISGTIGGSSSGGYGGGGTPTPPPSFGSFEDWSGSGKPGEGTAPNSGADYIRQMYEQMQKEQEAQLRSMYEAQLARLNGQQAQIDKEYADRANQAAAQADVQRMQMNDMGIAQGLNTGATGQLALGQSMALQGALGGLNQAAAQDKMENARDVNELSAMYNNKLQALSSGIQSDLMNALIEEYNRQQAIWMEQQQRAREEAWRQRQWEYQQQQDAWDRQKWQYQAQQDAWNRQMAQQAADEDRRRWELNFGLKANPTEATPVRPSGGGGNPRPTNPKPKPTQNWDNKGLSSDQIRQLQSMKPGLAVDGLWGPASSAAFGDMDAKTAWDTYGGSVKPAADPNFEQFMRVVGANIAQGNTKLAQQMIEQNWGRMTPEQQKRVNDFRASFN